jgi:hypothetical protein
MICPPLRVLDKPKVIQLVQGSDKSCLYFDLPLLFRIFLILLIIIVLPFRSLALLPFLILVGLSCNTFFVGDFFGVAGALLVFQSSHRLCLSLYLANQKNRLSSDEIYALLAFEF